MENLNPEEEQRKEEHTEEEQREVSAPSGEEPGGAPEGQAPAAGAAEQPSAEAAAAPPAEDFGTLFSKATSLWTGNIGNLIVITLVFILVAWIPIAGIGFFAGYIRALLKTARGEKAEIGDIFNAWDCFGPLFVYMIIIVIAAAILNIIPVLGQIAAVVLGFVLMPGMFAVVDKGTGAIDALKWSFKAFKAAIGNWALVILVGSVLGGLFAIVTLPWGYLMMLLQYESQKDVTFE